MFRSSRFLMSAGLVLGVAASSFAQQATQPRPAQPAQPGQATQPRARQQAQPGQASERMESRADAQLAACLIVDNEGEVALGKIAQERAQSQQVKKFAEQMVKDHGEMLTKLQKFAAEGRQRRPAGEAAQPQERRPAADKPGAAERPSEQARAGGAQRGGALNFVALKREIGQECLKSARKELESKEGQEFDMCYMTMMIVKHMQALDTVKVFKNHASDEFGQVLDEGTRTITTHLEHAKELGKQLHNQAVATARRDKTEK